jgi:signal transduction histidine kinase
MREGRGFARSLTLGLALVLLTLSATALVTLLLATARLRNDVEARTYFNNLLLAERLRGEVEQTVAAGRGYLLSGTPGFLQRMSQAQEAADRLLARLEHGPNTPGGRILLAQLNHASAVYNQAVAAAVRDGRVAVAPFDVAAVFERELLPRRRQMDRLLDSFVGQQQALLDQHSGRLKRQHVQFVYFGIGSFALGVLVSALLALRLRRHLTAQYRREEVAMARAEQAAASREELLAIVAHDLRSPLSAIRLRAVMLRTRGADEESRKHGEAVDRLVTRMDLLVRTLLDGATIENGQLSLNLTSWCADSVMAEVLELFAATAAAASVRLETAPVAGDLLVLADRERVIQVLSNLVGNAIKFARPGDRVELMVSRDNGSAQFLVADSGPGIPPDQLPRVFERFWRADSGKSGAGLGLYIARKIVESHSGRIWAQTRPEGGTAFRFTLPVAATDTASTGASTRVFSTPDRRQPTHLSGSVSG